MRRHRARLDQNLATLDPVAVHTAQKCADIVARLALIQKLAEHLDPRAHRLLGVADAYDLHLFANLDHAALHPARGHRAPARNREHILDRHQKRLIDRPLGRRNIRINRFHQLVDRFRTNRGIPVLKRRQRRAGNNRNVVPGIAVFRQKFANLHLNQFQQLLVIHLINLVEVNHHMRNADLTAQKNVLARLRHRTVRRVHHQNRPVHLSRTRDHVLHVIRVAGTVHMRIVTPLCLVFHMRRRNRDPSRLLLRRAVNRIIALKIAVLLRDRRRQRRLAVINVTNRANVYMRLRTIKLLFCHVQGAFSWAAMGRIDNARPLMELTKRFKSQLQHPPVRFQPHSGRRTAPRSHACTFRPV